MTKRPRLLFVAPRYLLPADSGGKIRTGHVLRGLKGGAFEVTLISPARATAAPDPAELEPLCDRYAGWPNRARGKFFAYTRARYILSTLPIPVATDVSAEGRNLIAAELALEPDLVVVDFPHTQALMPPETRIRNVLFTHNVEAEIFARHLDVARNPLLRAVWRNQLRKMVRFEADTLRKFRTVIAVSERDRAHFKKFYGVDAATIPTGVDLDQFQYRAPDRNQPADPNIVFTASMDSYANIDGMRWFMDEVWPPIAKERPNARVTIVGRKPDPQLVRTARERGLPWTFTGFVDDIRPYLYAAAVYIIPLRVGGGTRVKAYEAMASGRPVVSTAIGVEGLPVERGRHYLLADTASSFSGAVLELLRDGDLRAGLAGRARQLVQASFSATAVARAFERICLEALERGRRGS